MDQRQLPFKIADQFINVCFTAQKPQRIVSGDPAAAGGRTGPEALAPFVLWNIPLVADQTVHDCSFHPVNDRLSYHRSLHSFLAPARKEPKEAVTRGAERLAPAIRSAPLRIPRPHRRQRGAP